MGRISPCSWTPVRPREAETVDLERKTVLVVDDDDRSRESVVNALSRTGYRALSANSGVEAMTCLEREDVHLAILDLRMPGMDGISLLKALKRERPNVQALMLTAYGTIESTVEAMQEGAFGYLTKPINLAELRTQVRRALEHGHLSLEAEPSRAPGEQTFFGLRGGSEAMRRIYDMIRDVAPTTSTVLIRGESGTGKELIARAIHENSPRRRQPFVAVNCAAIPDGLLESELFGHERGAFTGADRLRMGVFEAADGGTLFLDEVGDIPLLVQVKLLRAIEQRAFVRLGGERTTRTDVRILAATHTDLEQAIESGRFREDFYYRLNVVNITVPPLRERRDDIGPLVTAFVRDYASENGRSVETITQDAMDALTRYDWPGNVRELRNCIESVVVRMKGKAIVPEMLPAAVQSSTSEQRVDVRVGMSMAEVEMRMIVETLAETGGNQTRAAKILQMGVRTLQRKIKQYGL